MASISSLVFNRLPAFSDLFSICVMIFESSLGRWSMNIYELDDQNMSESFVEIYR
jgi:hypothetical protein